MIKGIRHKGLKRLFEDGDRRGVNHEHAARLENILGLLHQAGRIEDLSLPTLRLHPLTGDRKGLWAVTVRANWRVVFRFEDGHVLDVDLVDYH